MDNTPQKPTLLSSLATVVLLVILPIVGIVFVWTLSHWNTALKIISTVLGAFWIVPYTLFMIALFYTGGSVQPLMDQDKQAISYLKGRYGQEFEIIRDLGGHSLGGPITYSKRAALKSDKSVEFSLSRCLARCTSGTSQYRDSYPMAVWSKQETQLLQANPGQYGVPIDASVSVQIHRQGWSFNEDDVWMLANNDTGVIAFREMDSRENNLKYDIYISLSKRNPDPTNDDFVNFANTIVGIRNNMLNKNIEVNHFTATIAPREQSDDSGWRFYTYQYTSPSNVADSQSAEAIASQFKKNAFSDVTLYNQINGKQ